MDYQPAELLAACAAYQRQIALAHLDYAPGEQREARLAEALEQCADVSSGPALAALQSQIAVAPAAAQAVLQRLRAWSLAVHVQRALLPTQQEIRAQQRTATCVVDEEAIPFLASFTAMANEKRRERRAAIEAAVGEQLATLNELFAAQFAVLGRLAESLDYPSLEAFWGDMMPGDAAAQEDVVTRFLADTADVYIDLLHWAVKRRLGIPPGQLCRHDIFALFPFPEYHQYYQPDVLITSLRHGLQSLGLDPRVDGRLTLRQRADTFGLPSALAVHIPDEIVLSYGQVSGLQGAEAYASAYGRALLWAHTAADLPEIVRLLGDPALPAGSAQVLAEMVALPGWLRHYQRVSVDSHYMLWHRLDRLYRLRRQLGRFLYTRHVYRQASLSGAQDAYREIMQNACLVDHAPAYYLLDWDWQYTSLTVWRSWAVAYGVLHTLQQQFAADWFRNPDAGAWLMGFWHGALGETVEALCQRLYGTAWEASLLAESLTQQG